MFHVFSEPHSKNVNSRVIRKFASTPPPSSEIALPVRNFPTVAMWELLGKMSYRGKMDLEKYLALFPIFKKKNILWKNMKKIGRNMEGIWRKYEKIWRNMKECVSPLPHRNGTPWEIFPRVGAWEVFEKMSYHGKLNLKKFRALPLYRGSGT